MLMISLLLYIVTTQHELETKIKSDMELLNNWLRMKLLTRNTGKHYMIFKQKKKTQIQLNIHIYGQEITRTNTVQYLELDMEDKLTWNNNINKIRNKLNALI